MNDSFILLNGLVEIALNGSVEGTPADMLCFTYMSQEQAINDILEILGAVKDNMVTKDEFDYLKEDVLDLKQNIVSKDYLHEALFDVKSEIMSHVDSFIHLHNKLDTELVALRAKYDRLEGFVKQLAAHAHITLEY